MRETRSSMDDQQGDTRSISDHLVPNLPSGDPNATLEFSLGQYQSTVWLDGIELNAR